MSFSRVEYLNHASLRLDLGGVRLLSDPWFSGTAFAGGWGLRYANPAALSQAAEATHLWISHWHSDHLHVPTLRELASRRPDMVVLANVSANFSMRERLTSLGFSRVLTLPERKPLALSGEVSVERYPTAGIDNMLVIRAGSQTLLNYNDCNLPGSAVRRLVRQVGPIDVLFTNYNHAGKLYDEDDDQVRRERLWQVLAATADATGAKQVFPFASNHYYRVAESQAQNGSLLTPEDLTARSRTDPRFVIVPVGGAAEWREGRLVPETPHASAQVADETCHVYGPSIAWPELVAAAEARCRSLQRQFLWTGRWWPELRIWVRDHRRLLRLRLGRVPRVCEHREQAHVECHSAALFDWLGRPFGDDTFVAGAHFGLVDRDTSAMRRWALVTLLDASHVAPRHVLGYATRADGRDFLWNRREEIGATLAGRRFKAGEIRL